MPNPWIPDSMTPDEFISRDAVAQGITQRDVAAAIAARRAATPIAAPTPPLTPTATVRPTGTPVAPTSTPVVSTTQQPQYNYNSSWDLSPENVIYNAGVRGGPLGYYAAKGGYGLGKAVIGGLANIGRGQSERMQAAREGKLPPYYANPNFALLDSSFDNTSSGIANLLESALGSGQRQVVSDKSVVSGQPLSTFDYNQEPTSQEVVPVRQAPTTAQEALRHTSQLAGNKQLATTTDMSKTGVYQATSEPLPDTTTVQSRNNNATTQQEQKASGGSSQKTFGDYENDLNSGSWATWTDADWQALTSLTGVPMNASQALGWMQAFAAEHIGNNPMQEGPFRSSLNNLLDHLMAKRDSMEQSAMGKPVNFEGSYYNRYSGPYYVALPDGQIVTSNELNTDSDSYQRLLPGQLPGDRWAEAAMIMRNAATADPQAVAWARNVLLRPYAKYQEAMGKPENQDSTTVVPGSDGNLVIQPISNVRPDETSWS